MDARTSAAAKRPRFECSDDKKWEYAVQEFGGCDPFVVESGVAQEVLEVVVDWGAPPLVSLGSVLGDQVGGSQRTREDHRETGKHDAKN